MRVALVSEHANPLAALGGVDAGGQNVHVANLARGLGRRGMDVVIHSRRDDPDVPATVRLAPGVVVHHVDAGPPAVLPKDGLLPYMDVFAARLRRHWRAWRPDLVHSHFWMSGRAALAAAPPLGVPVVHTFHALGTVKRRHQGAADTSPPQRLAEEKRIAARADRIVATCSDEVRELAAIGADPARVVVVPCGVDVELFRPRPAPARSDGVLRLVAVARLVERKGVGDAIAALARLPRAELVVAGGPPVGGLLADPEARRLARLARAHGVAGRVRFVGRLGRAQVAALLASADVAVCLPWYEPFGIVPLEAAACGVPVVGSAVGGLCDTVVDGVTGLLVPPRDPDAVAAAVAALAADPDRRRRMGQAALQRARRRYTWQRVTAETSRVYTGLAGDRALAGVVS